MNICITFRDDLPMAQSWFGSGIAQNLKFYYEMFELMGHSVSFLVSSPIDIEVNGKLYNYKTRSELLEDNQAIDVIIEGGVTISTAEQELFRDRCGAKIVGLRCGHQYYVAAEGLFVSKDLCMNQFVGGHDCMWLLPHHSDQGGWLSILHGCKAHEVPYIWEPDFVTQSFEDMDSISNPNIVVMEPNISVAKNALIPMAAVQRLYDIDADSFEKAYIYNSDSFANDDNFIYNFATTLPVLQANAEKILFEQRKPFTDVFDKPHILLSHQFHNELNYLLNEAIYMGIPLVHNSPAYTDIGYYYEGMNALQAADRTLEAIKTHSPKKSAEKGRVFLHAFSIHNTDVQKKYQSLLLDVLNKANTF